MAEWRRIPEFEYEISNDGQVRNLRGLILKQRLTTHGYASVSLSKKGRHHSFTVHRLVVLVFLGPRPDGYQTNHKDAIKTNNRLSNLEYVTPEQNRHHARRLGLYRGSSSTFIKGDLKIRGEGANSAKLTNDQVLQIRRLYNTGNYTVSGLSRMFGVARSTLRYAADPGNPRATWTHVHTLLNQPG